MSQSVARLLVFLVSLLIARAQDLRTRAAGDLPDDSTGYQVHVMYVLPSDGVDRRLDLDGQIDISVASFQSWLSSQSGGRQLRMDTFQGRLDVTFFRTRKSNEQIVATGSFVRDALEAEILAAGFRNPEKIYAIYYDGRSSASCGGGAWPPSLTGSVAALYLQGTPPGAPPCNSNRFTSVISQPGYLEFAMLHEIFHNLGSVPSCAPNHVLSGHVSDDPRDLMYAGSQAWQPSVLDANRNDYFKHGCAGCLDIADSAFLTAGAGQQSGPPPTWPLIDAPTLPCSQETASRSQPGSTPTVLQVVNGTGEQINISWIPFNGGRQQFQRLDPAQGYLQNTFGGHQWIATDASGRCLGMFGAVAPFRRFILVPPQADRPAFASSSVVEAFTGQRGMAPGAWVSLFGTNLAPAPAVWSPAADAPLPTLVGGVSVFVAGRRAPIWFVSPTQINFLVPADAPIGEVPVIVRNGNVESPAVGVPNRITLPALYALPLSGLAPVRFYVTTVSATLEGGSAVLVGNRAVDSRVARGARAGEVVQMFAIGLGATGPDLYTDRPLSSVLPLRDPVTVRFGNTPGRVLSAGLVSSGLYQINVEIPTALSAGEVQVFVEAGGALSHDAVFITIE